MEKFSFFNDVNDDRVYYAEDWARHLKKYFTNGIFNNELNVVSNNDMTITIKEGDANIEGYRYTNTGDLVKTIDNADGTLNRIDNIVLRLDLTNRLISAQIIKGTFADKPVAPELVRTSTIYDLRIAKISIPAGTTTITQDLITDTRFITSDCGNVISTVQTPDTENLFIQMQTLFEKQINELNNNFEIWFDSIKNQLDSDAAGNLQNQINNLNSNKVDNAKFDLDSNNLQLLANGKNVGDSVHIPTGITDTATGEEDLKIVNNRGVVKFLLEGKTEQKTSKKGKNLIGLKKGFTQTVNGMTVSVQDDGGLRVTGTPTKISESYIPLEGVSSISNGDYTLSVKTIGSTPSNACRLLKTNLASAANSFKSTALSCQSNTTKSMSATITDEEVYTYFYFYTNANVTIDATIYPQLEKGATYTEWVEFTPDSPSPDYPQKIVNVRGIENLFKPTLATTVLNGITCAANRDGTYTLNGTATADTTFTIGTDENLIIDKTYKFLGCPNGGSSTTYRMSWNFHNYEYGNGLISKKTSEARNVQITIFKGITASNLIFKPMFTEDTLSTYNDYVPYGSNYLSFKNVGKNLFNYTPVLITQVKSNLRTNNIYPNSNILLKKGTYILSFPDMVMKNNIKEFGVQLFDNNTQLATLTLSNNKKSAIFTINNDANINRLYTYLDNSDNNDATITYKNIQLEKGTVATDYESYEKKYINIDLQGNELCSNLDKTTNDELIVENSRAKIIKKYDEVILTGSENWSINSSSESSKGYYEFSLTLINKPTLQVDLICNKFQAGLSYNNSKEQIRNRNDSELYINVLGTRLSSLNAIGFKSWLKSQYDSGNPVRVQYELVEPKAIDLGEVDFELLEGNSTLNLEEDLKSNMSIKYYTDSTVVDLKKKVENKQNVILHGTTAPSNDLGEDGDIYLQHN